MQTNTYSLVTYFVVHVLVGKWLKPDLDNNTAEDLTIPNFSQAESILVEKMEGMYLYACIP